LNNNRI